MKQVSSCISNEVNSKVIRKAYNNLTGNEVIGACTVQERKKSSTWRETEAVKRVIMSNVEQLRGKKVKVFSGNKIVESVLDAGSGKEELKHIATELYSFL